MFSCCNKSDFMRRIMAPTLACLAAAWAFSPPRETSERSSAGQEEGFIGKRDDFRVTKPCKGGALQLRGRDRYGDKRRICRLIPHGAENHYFILQDQVFFNSKRGAFLIKIKQITELKKVRLA